MQKLMEIHKPDVIPNGGDERNSSGGGGKKNKGMIIKFLKPYLIVNTKFENIL